MANEIAILHANMLVFMYDKEVICVPIGQLRRTLASYLVIKETIQPCH